MMKAPYLGLLGISEQRDGKPREPSRENAAENLSDRYTDRGTITCVSRMCQFEWAVSGMK